MIVRPEESYFSISTVRRFAQTGRLSPLVNDGYINIDGEIIKRYEGLVSKCCQW